MAITEFDKGSVKASGGGAAIGTAVTGATQGSVLFAGAAGVLAQNNASFFWDDANTQLKLAPGAANKTPFKITLFAAQSVDAFQVFASDGTTQLLGITSAGHTIRGNSANQQLILNSASEAALQYDSTNRFRAGGAGLTLQFATGRSILFEAGGSNFCFFPNASDTDIGLTAAPFANLFFSKYAELTEMTAPAAPAADKGRLFLQDNGAGKTQLMILFSSGAAQQIAIQP